jgi:hypothetical protein
MFNKGSGYMKIKRILGSLLSLGMLLSPMSVCADETIVAQSADGNQTYTDIDTAWSAAQNGVSIVMTSDWGVSQCLTLGEGKEATIEMNGHSIYRADLSDIQANGGVINLEDSSTLTLTGNKNPETTFNYVGHNMDASQDNTLTSGGLITKGVSEKGGALYMSESSKLVLDHVAIAGNQVEGSGEGGAIYMKKDCSCQLKNSLFTYNFGYDGGAIYVEGKNANIVLDNSSISYNYASQRGGGIYSYNTNTQITMKNNSHIDYNEAYKCGGGIDFEFSGFSITSNDDKGVTSTNTISNNSSSYGGGISVCQDRLTTNSGTISGITFDSNHADYKTEASLINSNGKGGAIYIEQEDIMVSDCTLTNNTSLNYGGGIYIYNDGLTVKDCVIQSNTSAAGGGIYVNEHEDIILDGKNIISKNKRTDGNADDLMLDKSWSTTAYVMGKITRDSSVGIRTGDNGTTQIGKNITYDPDDAVFLNDSGDYHIEYDDGKLYKREGLTGSIFGNGNTIIAACVMGGIAVIGIVVLVYNKKKTVK